MITSSSNCRKELGWWSNNGDALFHGANAMFQAISSIHSALYVVEKGGSFAFGRDGSQVFGDRPLSDEASLPIVGYVPALRMEYLGDRSFCKTYGIRYPLVAGAMANGICSTEIVEEMGKNGMLAFFGAAGLSLDRIERAVDCLKGCSGNIPFGFNLIHSPNEPQYEAAVVDLYLRREVRLVEASAYMDVTLPVVKYRTAGIYRDADGNIVTPNRVIAKVSRIEVASKFFAPPPEKLLSKLVESGDISQEQAELAGQIPLAQDITAEADSGGHTDNRPAITIVPTLMALKERMQSAYAYKQRLRLGAGGGIATPAAVAAMFAMGAAYVVTGSVNQSCVEAGTSDIVREMLSRARQADVAMAPAADMFEMGVKVQVLKQGTMFAMRASKLYDLYCKYDGLNAIPVSERTNLEKNIFCDSIDSIWAQTRNYFVKHDLQQVARAGSDSKHKMALVFRWYLGQSSVWANSGVASRKMDYQVWCGPAIGAFNEWVRGSCLDDVRNRKVAAVSLNLLYGAAVNMRLNALRSQGFSSLADDFHVAPVETSQLMEFAAE